MQSPPRRPPASEWVSIGRASQLLGVKPATLRQWTTLGKLHAYRTPGGHRRFRASEIASIAETEAAPRAPAVARMVVEQLRQRYHAVAQSALPSQSWILELDESARAQFHELGDAFLGCLGQYVTTTVGPQRRSILHAGRALAARYGELCRESGLHTGQAVEAYVLFRRPLLDVLGKTLAAHPERGAEVSRIMRDVELFMDEVLASVAGAAEPGDSTTSSGKGL